MKVIFTGGHHNCALEVAKVLKQQRPDIEILWLGHKYASLGDLAVSAEYKEVTGSGLAFRDLKAGKVYKTFNLVSWFRVPFGFLQSIYYLWQFKPSLIISFGGYVAAPVVLAGFLLGVPSVTHEQTTAVGLANQLIARIAKKVFITWSESAKYFPPEKVYLTGLPLRESIFKVQTNRFHFANNQPVIYITGGKQGSHVINTAVFELMPELLRRVNVIHQTGSNSQTADFARARNIQKSLPEELKGCYHVCDYIFEHEIGEAFAKASLVVSRSGAHTVYELAALGKPAIFIPIPWSSHNEQYKNALVLSDLGAAIILPQDQLTSARLEQEIVTILDNLPKYQQNSTNSKKIVKMDASTQIVDQILAFL